ncbi:MAG: hypothetical protein ACRDHP_11835, partial [Ktedonobacterales bacterium]
MIWRQGRNTRSILVASGVLVVLLVATVVVGIVANRTPTGATNVAKGANCASSFVAAPSSGPVGTAVTISGNGWPASHEVGIYFVDSAHRLRPENVSRFQTSGNGSWSTTITIPAVVSFNAVGDNTTSKTGTSATQTFSQPVGAGNYLIYAAASNAPTFSVTAV